jgi:hypothetical protein
MERRLANRIPELVPRIGFMVARVLLSGAWWYAAL